MRGRFASRVHQPGPDLLEISSCQQPGDGTKQRRAEEEAEDAQHDHQRAPMRFYVSTAMTTNAIIGNRRKRRDFRCWRCGFRGWRRSSRQGNECYALLARLGLQREQAAGAAYLLTEQGARHLKLACTAWACGKIGHED